MKNLIIKVTPICLKCHRLHSVIYMLLLNGSTVEWFAIHAIHAPMLSYAISTIFHILQLTIKSMRKHLFFLICFLVQIGWSQNTAKPWAYWWWLGSAVDTVGIDYNIEAYAKAGFGGLHIIPIYGIKGQEEKHIDFLSPQWVTMLDYTIKKANSVGMGIDMTLGTGWPYGGPHVTPQHAAKSFKLKEENGLTTFESMNTLQLVKRAAPGALGLVIDHFNKAALTAYLKPFDSIFSQNNYGVRAFYNDSYEAYGANWTGDFLQKFKSLRGYDLSPFYDVLVKEKNLTEQEKRIWADYHETLSDLIYLEFTKPLAEFTSKYKKILRNEAHGSPANILDLYALSTIPETEFFGSKSYPIPYYRQDPDYEVARFGKPEDIVLKLASSPANIMGKKLVSSETATWLGNHFKVSLSQIKPIIDESFIGGVNHIFYHGIPYTPPQEPYPGWLFYASTNFNFNSHFFNELPYLNQYVTNCQEKLQNSTPDNDVLLYLPVQDLWHSAGKSGKTHAIDVHNIYKNGVFNPAYVAIIGSLKRNGYAFDFISDRQVLNLTFDKKIITEGQTKYQVIVIPKVEYMPLETINKIQELKKKGAKILFVDALPTSVNGFYNAEKRQASFDAILPLLKKNISINLVQDLRKIKVRSEPMTSMELSFLRKKIADRTLYFISNLSGKRISQNIGLSSKGSSISFFNPLTGSSQTFALRKNEKPLIQLDPGESIFLELSADKSDKLFPQKNTSSQTILLDQPWNLSFIEGKPQLPKSTTIEKLQSWTSIEDSLAKSFQGVGKYTSTFVLDANHIGKSATLYLGNVRESAKVIINGKDLGTTWSLPFKVEVPAQLLQGSNSIEIQVRNNGANYIRNIDQKGTAWKKFYDINMVDIQYKPFDASRWKDEPSGLLGPIFLNIYNE
jgi:hypothetical protein